MTGNDSTQHDDARWWPVYAAVAVFAVVVIFLLYLFYRFYSG